MPRVVCPSLICALEHIVLHHALDAYTCYQNFDGLRITWKLLRCVLKQVFSCRLMPLHFWRLQWYFRLCWMLRSHENYVYCASTGVCNVYVASVSSKFPACWRDSRVRSRIDFYKTYWFLSNCIRTKNAFVIQLLLDQHSTISYAFPFICSIAILSKTQHESVERMTVL